MKTQQPYTIKKAGNKSYEEILEIVKAAEKELKEQSKLPYLEQPKSSGRIF